jgi:hypothetical protein
MMNALQDTVLPTSPVFTVGELRERMSKLPDEARILVVVRDQHHFNRVLHDAAVLRATRDNSPAGPVLALDVQGIS